MKIFVVLAIFIFYVNQSFVYSDEQETAVPDNVADSGVVPNVDNGSATAENPHQPEAQTTGNQNTTNVEDVKISIQSCWASGAKIGSNSIQNGSGTRPPTTTTTRKPTTRPTTRRPARTSGGGMGIF